MDGDLHLSVKYVGKPGYDIIIAGQTVLMPLHLFNSTASTRYAWLVGQLIPTHLGLVMVDKPKKRRLHIREGAQADSG